MRTHWTIYDVICGTDVPWETVEAETETEALELAAGLIPAPTSIVGGVIYIEGYDDVVVYVAREEFANVG